MAYRAKDEQSPDELDELPTPSSKIFKALQESEAGKSFRRSSKPTPSPRALPSAAPDEGDQPRSIRANAAMRLRESMDQNRTAGTSKSGRVSTSNVSKLANARYDSDELDENGTLEDTDENRDPRLEGIRTLSQRSALIAQLEGNANKTAQSSEPDNPSKGLQQHLIARFKSTSRRPRSIDCEGDNEEEQYLVDDNK
jgi:hypothetical protein